MNEENNTKGEKSLLEKLLGVLKELISLKDKIRGARRSLKCCSRSLRRAERWDAAAAKYAAEAKAAAEAGASAEAKAAEEAGASAEAKAAALRGRNEEKYRIRLDGLRKERAEMIASARSLIAKIGGYRRRDRKEVKRLMVAVGLY